MNQRDRYSWANCQLGPPQERITSYSIVGMDGSNMWLNRYKSVTEALTVAETMGFPTAICGNNGKRCTPIVICCGLTSFSKSAKNNLGG